MARGIPSSCHLLLLRQCANCVNLSASLPIQPPLSSDFAPAMIKPFERSHQSISYPFRRGRCPRGCRRGSAPACSRDRNQQFMSTNSPASSSGTKAQSGATGAHGHHVCHETPRGTPFRWSFYSGAFDDVCPSHKYASLGNYVRSYWQVGSGRTYFYFVNSNLHWWLDGSSAAVGGMMDSYVIHHYTWGASH